MDIVLEKKPKNVTIIEGFPGFGLVSTIVTEYLATHLDADQIGKIVMKEVPPTVLVHSGKVIDPIGIFYSKKYNLVILHAMTSVTNYEWLVADKVVELAKLLTAKEVICIEGVGSQSETSGAFYISETNSKNIEKKTGLKKLSDGIILGVTGSLMLKKSLPISCIFAETHSSLPDSRAAAKIIEVLDKYLDLKVDPKPLIKRAEQFEEQIKSLMEKSKDATEQKAKKELSYLG